MKKQQKLILALAIITAFAAAALFLPGLVSAGDLEPSAGPDDPGSAMYTLDDIYNRLNDNTTATKRSGAFTEPSEAPGSTGHTLDQIYELALPTRVEKTGQTTSHSATDGEDGDLEKGVAWPSPRFTDNTDGTVTDNLTGLIWLKNANRFGQKQWAVALSDCNALADDGTNLTDGSSAGDWRLPNVRELFSLVHFGVVSPAVPNTAGTGKWADGDPFTNVQSNYYWSSTTYEGDSPHAWDVDMYGGYMNDVDKTFDSYVWPVRGGN